MPFINENQKTLYHGSSRDIMTIAPFPSRVVGGEKVVFGSMFRGIALCFVSPSWTDKEIDLGLVNGKPTIKELQKGAFGYLKVSGYLYSFFQDGFTHDKRIGLFEMVSHKEVKPFKKEYFENVLEQLTKEDIEMIYF